MTDFGSERPLAACSRMNDVGCAQPIRAPPSCLFTHDLDPNGVTSPSGELILTGRPNDWS